MERVASGFARPLEDILGVLDDDKDDWGWRRLFIGFGEYAPALRQIYDLFPENHVKVLIYEDFVRDPSNTCHAVFEFLELETSFEPRTNVVYNAYREPSSRAAGALVRWLRRRDNSVKRVAQRTLPPAAFDRIGNRLLGLSQREAHADDMPANLRERLGEYYRPLNCDLAQMLQQDLSHWTGMGTGVATNARAPERR
jgi:hypothetical protein